MASTLLESVNPSLQPFIIGRDKKAKKLSIKETQDLTAKFFPDLHRTGFRVVEIFDGGATDKWPCSNVAGVSYTDEYYDPARKSSRVLPGKVMAAFVPCAVLKEPIPVDPTEAKLRKLRDDIFRDMCR